MYGLVNKAIEELIVSRFGPERWLEVKSRAGVHDELFFSHESYPDDVTYRLIAAASEVMGMEAREVLLAFGTHWVMYTGRSGYGSILEANGRDLGEFLRNLPTLHSRVAMIFPDLRPPRFECREITATSMELHYFSHRVGLADFVEGLIHGLGQMFDTPIEVAVTSRKADGADHDTFEIRWKPNPSP